MAFLDVHPDWQIETGFRLDPSSFRVTRTSRRHFTCERTDPSNDTPIRAEQQHIFPVEGDPDPDDLNRFCVSATIRPFGLTALECFADYESLPLEVDVATQQQVLAGWSFEFDSEDSEEPIDRARDVFPRTGRNTANIENGLGLAITTIVGESYDPPLTDTASDLAFTLSTTNRPFRPELLWLYRNAVNSDTFLGVFPAGTCRMRQARGTQARSEGSLQWNVTCRVVIRSAAPGSVEMRAWWKRVRAEGFYANSLESVVAGEPRKFRVLDDYGEPSVKPALHYTSGANQLGVQIFGEDAHENAEFYEFQPPSVVYRPFNTFFQAIVAG